MASMNDLEERIVALENQGEKHDGFIRALIKRDWNSEHRCDCGGNLIRRNPQPSQPDKGYFDCCVCGKTYPLYDVG